MGTIDNLQENPFNPPKEKDALRSDPNTFKRGRDFIKKTPSHLRLSSFKQGSSQLHSLFKRIRSNNSLLLEYAFQQRRVCRWLLNECEVNPFMPQELRWSRHQVMAEVLILHHVDKDGKYLKLRLCTAWDPLVAGDSSDEVHLHHVDTRVQYSVESSLLDMRTWHRPLVRSQRQLIR